MARHHDKAETPRLIEQIGSMESVVKVISHSVLETIKEDLDVKFT
nr:hypothetical protein [Candidatus Njordarchaeota archaeon]